MKIIKPLFLLLLSIAIIVIVVIAVVKTQHRICEEIDISIDYSGTSLPVSESELQELLENEGIKIIGEELKSIDEKAIFNTLKKNPFIKEIKPIRLSGNTLHIDIVLRKLIVHVFPLTGSQYFIDEDGVFVPFNKNVKERLPIANGNISETYHAKMTIKEASQPLKTVFEIAKTVEKNQFYHAYFKQLFVNQQNEIEIVPSVGKHIILMSSGADVEEKLFQLEKTCQQGLAYMNPDQYRVLDLRYKNRIIAKKAAGQ
ncbi:MAG TPA: hypothetical protein PK548_07670 [Bacteroidales bacterium]|jgi:cell division protein FtsQ|nr:hypothetical protein [Bacteroidales bacterium]